MRGGDRRAELVEQEPDFLASEQGALPAAPFNQREQRLALDVLHDQERDVRVYVKLSAVDDVRMADPGQDLELLAEAAQKPCVPEELRVEHLERDEGRRWRASI